MSRIEWITKGTRVADEWFEAREACLAGVQAKLAAVRVSVSGTVRHVYGTSPSDPDPLLYIDPESPWGGPVVNDCSCGGPHVAVASRHVVGATTRT